MKLYKVSVITGLALSGLVASTNLSLAQDQKGAGKRGPSVERRMERMDEDLKLTDAQKPKIKAVLEETQKKMQEMFTDSSVPRDERREKRRELMDGEKKKLKEILTPEQFSKYEKSLEDLRGKGGKNRKKGQDGQEKKD